MEGCFFLKRTESYIRLIDCCIKEYDTFWKTVICIEFIELLDSTLLNGQRVQSIKKKSQRTVAGVRGVFSSRTGNTTGDGKFVRSTSIPTSDDSESFYYNDIIHFLYVSIFFYLLMDCHYYRMGWLISLGYKDRLPTSMK